MCVYYIYHKFQIIILYFSYKVCSIIHEKAGEHGQVVRCYLLDNVRKHEVFDYIDRSAHKEYLRPYIVDNIDASIKLYYRSVYILLCLQLVSVIINNTVS